MALTRGFRETVVARAKRDPAFKTALLQEALQAFLDGEVAPGLILLRDCINATIGFGALSKATHPREKPDAVMVGLHGNPTADNLSHGDRPSTSNPRRNPRRNSRRKLRSNAPIAPSNRHVNGPARAYDNAQSPGRGAGNQRPKLAHQKSRRCCAPRCRSRRVSRH
jgi:hypothetical protein